jgi:methylmalonyl-CoA/ethylmalonyl-CoA epimerase
MSSDTISHIGIAVADLNEAIQRYRLLTGDSNPKIETVPDQKVKVAIFSGGDKSTAGRIELVAATSPDSPIARFVDKRGEGLHHVCIYVDNLDTRLAELKAAGVRLIDELPRIGAEGGRIAFVHPSAGNGVLIELEERR